jgi:hypothetical protein
MSKLQEDVRAGILGAAAGLFAVSISLMIARVDAYYAYLSWLDETNHDSYSGVESLWWVPVAVWHLILSITASLLAHRYLAARLRSPFLLWQVIGVSSLVGWALTVLLAIGMDGLMTGRFYAVQHGMNSGEAATIFKYVSVAFASNVFYASIIKASSGQYTTQFDELAGESSNGDRLLTTS